MLSSFCRIVGHKHTLGSEDVAVSTQSVDKMSPRELTTVWNHHEMGRQQRLDGGGALRGGRRGGFDRAGGGGGCGQATVAGVRSPESL